MHYFVAIICPPLAVLFAGFRPLSFILSILLTMCFYVPGLIHAILVVSARKADKRMDRHTKAMKKIIAKD